MRFPFASIAILAALATAEPEPKPTSDIEPTSSIGHTEKHLSLREEYKTLTGHMKEKRDDVRNTCGVVVDKDTQLGGLWQTPTEPKECRLLRAKPFKFFEMLSGCRSCELWKGPDCEGKPQFVLRTDKDGPKIRQCEKDGGCDVGSYRCE